jgi:pimeloyl-ACP methyl ester carboxylesterase
VARGFLLFVVLICACHPQAALAGQPQYLEAHMPSPLLSAFWKTPVNFDAHILLPDSFYKEPQRRYPIFYWIEGFDARGTVNLPQELDWQRPMRELHEEYIVVFLNGMFNGGHDEFADSANNGPWGMALTTEFIPQTEAHFRAIGTEATRFVGGHSSGGWSALWLQITYPELFGGEWSISPDPVDFRDFTGPDITRSPPQNFFSDDAGHMYMLENIPLRVFVVGRGWRIRQFESFDAVFSPKGADGRPRQLFDRHTGIIDAEVAKYWEEHYDIARVLRQNWSTFAPLLRGKLHIVVGSSDQFGLDRPVALLEKELRGLGSDAQFDYVKGANHFTVFDWRGGAIGEILREASGKLPADPP